MYRHSRPVLHHRLLIHNLERVASGEIDRLAVFMPPGSAKSAYSSILFPPWFLAQQPKASVLAASHTSELAEKWGRDISTVKPHGDTSVFGSANGNSQSLLRSASKATLCRAKLRH
jgi:hypothetical protein